MNDEGRVDIYVEISNGSSELSTAKAVIPIVW